MKFQVIFTFDSEYAGYVAEVPQLPGCVSQGKTLDEAIENIKDAITGYLHVQAKHGKPYIVKESQVFIGDVYQIYLVRKLSGFLKSLVMY